MKHVSLLDPKLKWKNEFSKKEENFHHLFLNPKTCYFCISLKTRDDETKYKNQLVWEWGRDDEKSNQEDLKCQKEKKLDFFLLNVKNGSSYKLCKIDVNL